MKLWDGCFQDMAMLWYHFTVQRNITGSLEYHIVPPLNQGAIKQTKQQNSLIPFCSRTKQPHGCWFLGICSPKCRAKRNTINNLKRRLSWFLRWLWFYMIVSFEIIGIRRFLQQETSQSVCVCFFPGRFGTSGCIAHHRATAQLRGWDGGRFAMERIQESLEESLSDDSKLRWIWAPENLKGLLNLWTCDRLKFPVFLSLPPNQNTKKRGMSNLVSIW